MGGNCSTSAPCTGAIAQKEASYSSRLVIRRPTTSTEKVGVGDKASFNSRYISCSAPSSASRDVLFSVVVSGTGLKLACRTVPKSGVSLRDPHILTDYFKRLSSLEHPHLCKFVEAFEDSEYFYMIYEKASEETLVSHIRGTKIFTESDVADCVRQLVAGLAAGHERDICHGSLTPSDVLLSQSMKGGAFEQNEAVSLKICDMGLSLVLRQDLLRTALPGLQVGRSPMEDARFSRWANPPERQVRLIGAMAPEVAWDESPAVDGCVPVEHAKPADVWGVGVITYLMMVGYLPFVPKQGDNPRCFLERVREGHVVFSEEDWSVFPKEARECVESMLKINPGLRPDACRLLRHPWLRLKREQVSKATIGSVLRNVRMNAMDGPLKRAVLHIIARSQLSLETRRELATVFRTLDRSGDGIIGESEMVAALQKYAPTEEDIDDVAIFRRVDQDATGSISLMEFIAAAVPQSDVLTPQMLWPVFRALDKDLDGSVTLNEIEAMALHLYSGWNTGDRMKNMLAALKDEIDDEIGADSSDAITFDDFIDIMTMPTDQVRGFWQTMRRGTLGVLREGLGVDVYGTTKSRFRDVDLEKTADDAKGVYIDRVATGIRRSFSWAAEASGQKLERTPVHLVGSTEPLGRPPMSRNPSKQSRRSTSSAPSARGSRRPSKTGTRAMSPPEKSPRPRPPSKGLSDAAPREAQPPSSKPHLPPLALKPSKSPKTSPRKGSDGQLRMSAGIGSVDSRPQSVG